MSKKLGKMIKDARADKGLSQAELAESAGVSASEIGKIERGEKEPSRDVLKKMAKPLGLTQKALLEAASGSGTGSADKSSGTGKGSSSGKTSGTGKSSGTDKTSSAKAAASVGTLSATEKKLVQLYRKADSYTKKAAMNLLSGEGNVAEILGSLVLGKNDVSSMASGLLETLLSGKTGSGTRMQEETDPEE
jgi:DNA-binding XRE family transcriptional regulator